MLHFLLVPVALVMTSATALASNWTPIPDQPSAFVDTNSVRLDSYPTGVYAANGKKIYTVAWLAIVDEKGAFQTKVEVAFDCRGKAGVIQQIVTNDSKDAPFHTFDKTPAFDVTGVMSSSIAPDSFYEGAEKMVCPAQPVSVAKPKLAKPNP